MRAVLGAAFGARKGPPFTAAGRSEVAKQGRQAAKAFPTPLHLLPKRSRFRAARSSQGAPLFQRGVSEPLDGEDRSEITGYGGRRGRTFSRLADMPPRALRVGDSLMAVRARVFLHYYVFRINRRGDIRITKGIPEIFCWARGVQFSSN